MRTSNKGLHRGTTVHVIGHGKRGNGVISREPAPDATHVYYRSVTTGNEHFVPIERVRRVDGPRTKKEVYA